MNVHRLARAAAILDMPLIFTTSEEHGPNGALLPTLKEIRPDAYEYRIDRHGIIDSLADPAVDKAVSATAFGHDISLRRLEREGVDLTTTASGQSPSSPAHTPVLRDHARLPRRHTHVAEFRRHRTGQAQRGARPHRAAHHLVQNGDRL
jgi:hypothetical protein